MSRRHDRWVAWDQWALNDLTVHLDLSVTAARVLRRLVLDADWHDHTVPLVGGRTALAQTWHLGTSSGRRTLGHALDELVAARCIRMPARYLVEVSVYDDLVCHADRDPTERMNATWIRPGPLHEVAERTSLSFQQRSLLEVLLTMAGADGVVLGARQDMALRANSARYRVVELVDAGLLTRTTEGWQIVDFAGLVKTGAARVSGSSAAWGKSPTTRAQITNYARENHQLRAYDHQLRARPWPLTSTFGPCTSTDNYELGAAGLSGSVVPAAVQLADETIEQARSGLREARDRLVRGRGSEVITEGTVVDADEVFAGTGTDGL